MSKRLITACILLLLLVMLTSCASNKNNTPADSSNPPSGQVAVPPAVPNQTPAWVSDGKISSNEYSSSQNIGDLKVFTRVSGDSVMIGLTAVTEGYLSLGIDPEGSLRDVDIIMCAIDEGRPVVGDYSGSGKHFPHPADVDAGGKMDLTDINGARDGSTAVLEFKRKLDTGDIKDQALKIGENRVIWAVGDKADFTSPHSGKGSGTLILVSN